MILVWSSLQDATHSLSNTYYQLQHVARDNVFAYRHMLKDGITSLENADAFLQTYNLKNAMIGFKYLLSSLKFLIQQLDALEHQISITIHETESVYKLAQNGAELAMQLKNPLDSQSFKAAIGFYIGLAATLTGAPVVGVPIMFASAVFDAPGLLRYNVTEFAKAFNSASTFLKNTRKELQSFKQQVIDVAQHLKQCERNVIKGKVELENENVHTFRAYIIPTLKYFQNELKRIDVPAYIHYE